MPTDDQGDLGVHLIAQRKKILTFEFKRDPARVAPPARNVISIPWDLPRHFDRRLACATESDPRVLLSLLPVAQIDALP